MFKINDQRNNNISRTLENKNDDHTTNGFDLVTAIWRGFMLRDMRSYKKVFLGVLILGFFGVSAYDLYSTRPALLLNYDRPSNYTHHHIFGACELKTGHAFLLDVSLYEVPKNFVQDSVSLDSDKWNLECVKSAAREMNLGDGFARPLLLTTAEVLQKSREYNTSLRCGAHQIKHKYFVVQTAPTRDANFNQIIKSALMTNALELHDDVSLCDLLKAGVKIVFYEEKFLVSDEFKSEAVRNSYDTAVALKAYSINFVRDQRVSSKSWVSTIGKSTIFLISCLLVLVA